MEALSTELRRQLERTVIKARDVAEAGARGALEALAAHHHEPFDHMSGELRTLRNRLRAHARHLGDRVDARSGAHAIDHLVNECAYEHWHGMLFARFLAENQLLIEPEFGVAITLSECEELAKEEGVDKWTLAARFAHEMLPQVFRPDHPVFEVQLAREFRLKLEELVEGLPADVFTATDSLGWVYQFWQTRKKDEVNRSEVKIGADELPAVTQLFTEPYMVQFLLHNSLGAWWVSRHPDNSCGVDLTYLRRTEDGTPAAGAFEGWPDDLSEFRLLDPCCGSGHFLVAALLMLVPMRMTLEGMNAAAAVDAVLRENLHGLELDQRCVAIAAFALALEAWRYPGACGHRTLPKFNLAWCGQPVAGKKEQWLALAEGDPRLEAGMTALYDAFRDAPTLGSLIDPARLIPEDMLTADFDELQPLLEKALCKHAGEEEWEETAISALGLTETMRLLHTQYYLILTNVPYLSLNRQHPKLKAYTESAHSNARHDLANVFIERISTMLETSGSAALVAPQNWLFLKRYAAFREKLLRNFRWTLLARLGPGAFETISGEVVRAILFNFQASRPTPDFDMSTLDVDDVRSPVDKALAIRQRAVMVLSQGDQRRNPDCIVALEKVGQSNLLGDVATALSGCSSGDGVRFIKCLWEVPLPDPNWEYHQSTVKSTCVYGGKSQVIFWEHERGSMYELAQSVKDLNHAAQNWLRGKPNWRMHGVVVNQIGTLSATLYTGAIYDSNCCAIVPNDERLLVPIWAYCSSEQYHQAVRKLNQKLNVTPRTLLSVPFDLAHWTRIGHDKFPDGLPRPSSDDPTQWLFHGHPQATACSLQVAVARLVGYHWPIEGDLSIVLADEQRAWVEKAKALCTFEDEDGIVCIPSVRGERPGAERLLQLLHTAYGGDWNDGILATLLAEAGSASLDDWLRNRYFEEHCKLFYHRPFVWHIWDGRRRDGFHALVNYHKLAEGDGNGQRLLESLTYSYLGDWISRQHDGVKRGDGGAEDRLAAALELQKRLVAVLEGEPPFDLFVRWKPIEEQAIGWEPDINDGVRLNIRPFMAQDLPGGKKGAGILRAKPNIHWKKDRGKEPACDRGQYPWFWMNGEFTGERVNDVHLRIADKRAARAERGAATDD